MSVPLLLFPRFTPQGVQSQCHVSAFERVRSLNSDTGDSADMLFPVKGTRTETPSCGAPALGPWVPQAERAPVPSVVPISSFCCFPQDSLFLAVSGGSVLLWVVRVPRPPPQAVSVPGDCAGQDPARGWAPVPPQPASLLASLQAAPCSGSQLWLSAQGDVTSFSSTLCDICPCLQTPLVATAGEGCGNATPL